MGRLDEQISAHFQCQCVYVQAAVDSTITEFEGLKRTVTADSGAVQQLQRQMATLRRKLVSSRLATLACL